jgi:hypothetical protein
VMYVKTLKVGRLIIGPAPIGNALATNRTQEGQNK